MKAQIEYEGYTLEEGTDIDVVESHKLDARSFWEGYISKRKPVAIKGHFTDASWTATAKWTDDAYLIKKAGSAPVKVEKRDGPKDSYGRGRRVEMKFGDFVEEVASGNDTLYLTSQEVGVASDGHPELCTHPLSELAGDFDPRPTLAGNLVPQQTNLWFGANLSAVSMDALAGSSSGLHHDFHDNIYVLIRGKKRFRLYDPSCAPQMYTNGQLKKVYPNGRIVYAGQGEVNADGSDAADVALWEQKFEAEKELVEAEVAVKLGEKGAKKRLAKAEAALDASLEAQLVNAMDDDYNDDDGGADSDEESGDEDKGEGLGVETSDGEPVTSFSKVDMTMAAKAIKRSFPLFPGADAAMEVTVSAGEMLYIPTGWFHEVTSYGTPTPKAAASKNRAAASSATPGVVAPGHMAFNYWFHPPDNLDPSYDGYTKPYSSDFYPSLWRERVAQGMVGVGPPTLADSAQPHDEHHVHFKVPHGHHDHIPFEGVHADEHDGGTGHTVGITNSKEHVCEVPHHKPRHPPAGPDGHKGEEPGGAKKKLKKNISWPQPGEDAEEEDELQMVPADFPDVEMDDKERERIKLMIGQVLAQGMALMHGGDMSSVLGGRMPPKPKPPRGRRHHFMARLRN